MYTSNDYSCLAVRIPVRKTFGEKKKREECARKRGLPKASVKKKRNR